MTTNQVYDRYIELNMALSPAFIYRIHPEGLYSQINMVLNAAAFGLVHKRRLMVDARNIIGNWSDYFGVSLPGSHIAMSWPSDFLPRRYEWLRYRGGTMLLQWAETFHNAKRVVKLPELDFEGDVFEFYRLLASTLCQHAKPKQSIFAGDYVACHVRRGDKLISEGQFHDVSAYLEFFRKIAGDIKNVFVMTDDYSVIEDFHAQAPEYTIFTMCEPHQRGYLNAAFQQQSRAQSQRDLTKLQEEAAIACTSQVFIGCYLSNVSRFIALTHERPERCCSVDAQHCWIPGIPNFQRPRDWQPAAQRL